MDKIKILKKIGLKETYTCTSPNFYFWDESEFKNYTTTKYMKSNDKEVDEFYRIHESNLLHKKTGIRVKMLTSENYTGDEVTYKLYRVFILSKNNREVEIDDINFKKSIFICNKREIKFENILI
jgi:hypothetical protein